MFVPLEFSVDGSSLPEQQVVSQPHLASALPCKVTGNGCIPCQLKSPLRLQVHCYCHIGWKGCHPIKWWYSIVLRLLGLVLPLTPWLIGPPSRLLEGGPESRQISIGWSFWGGPGELVICPMLGTLDLPCFPLCPQRMRPSHPVECVRELWAVQYPHVWPAVTCSATSALMQVRLMKCHPYLYTEDRDISIRVVAMQANLAATSA